MQNQRLGERPRPRVGERAEDERAGKDDDDRGRGAGADPPRRIDDLEHDRVGLCHLAGDRRAVRDHTINWRNQRFRLAPDFVERGAPFSEALQLQPRFVELDA